jgi:hypothetical protein
MNICAMLDQQLHGRELPVGSCKMQRSIVMVISCFYVRTALQ